MLNFFLHTVLDLVYIEQFSYLIPGNRNSFKIEIRDIVYTLYIVIMFKITFITIFIFIDIVYHTYVFLIM